MEISTLNTIFTWVGIIAAFIAAISGLGIHFTSKIIEKEKTEEIKSLKLDIANAQPSIFSQSPLAINVPGGNLYTQSFNVSVDAPTSNMLIITSLNSSANRIGKTVVSATGKTGVRKRNGLLVPYENFIYTFKTDKMVDMNIDTIVFSTKPDPNTKYIGSE